MIDSAFFWQNTLLLALGTFTIRSFIIFISARIKISERFKEILSFIPSAILPAMIAPMVFFHNGENTFLGGHERLFVIILATVVCYYFKNMLVTIIFGLSLLFLLNYYF